MKRILPILTLLAICFTINLSATHNRAGEITFKQLSSLTFEINVVTYTKASSLQADRDSLLVCFGDGVCNWVSRSNGQGTTIGNDIKSNIYATTHSYAGLGTYTISMTDPNRNGNILNVNPPYSDQVPFHLSTELTVLNLQFYGPNNSPILSVPPIDKGCTGQPFIHNPAAYDVDGDSLVYELIVPLSGTGTLVNNYSFPNNIGGSGQLLSLDGLSGMLTWDAPKQSGEYNIAFVIKEYRNGMLISSTLRDMQITIETCNNRIPSISQTVIAITAEARDTIDFMMSINDFDGDDVYVEVFSQPTLDTSFVSPASFVVTNDGTNTPTAQFTWITDCEHVREQPYYIVIRAKDNFILNNIPHAGVNYWSIPITVLDDSDLPCPSTSSNISITEPVQEFKVFPNPAKTQATVELSFEEYQTGIIQLYNLVGQLERERTFKNEQNLQWRVNTADLAAGIYLVRVQFGANTLTKKLIVR